MGCRRQCRWCAQLRPPRRKLLLESRRDVRLRMLSLSSLVEVSHRVDFRMPTVPYSKKSLSCLQAEQHGPSRLAHCLPPGSNRLGDLLCHVRDPSLFLHVNLDILHWTGIWYHSDSRAASTEPVDTWIGRGHLGIRAACASHFAYPAIFCRLGALGRREIGQGTGTRARGRYHGSHAQGRCHHHRNHRPAGHTRAIYPTPRHAGAPPASNFTAAPCRLRTSQAFGADRPPADEHRADSYRIPRLPCYRLSDAADNPRLHGSHVHDGHPADGDLWNIQLGCLLLHVHQLHCRCMVGDVLRYPVGHGW